MEDIKKLWQSIPQKKYKQIGFSLEEKTIENIDTIASALESVTNIRPSRSQVVEYALNDYFKKFHSAFLEDHGYEPEVASEKHMQNKKDFDLVIFPAHYEGFHKAFLGEKKWYYVRINSKNIDYIKYVSCYVGTPECAVTHYAEVERIEKITKGEYEGKYEIYFKGEPVELEIPITLGKLNVNAMRAPRYTNLENLLNSETLDEVKFY